MPNLVLVEGIGLNLMLRSLLESGIEIWILFDEGMQLEYGDCLENVYHNCSKNSAKVVLCECGGLKSLNLMKF